VCFSLFLGWVLIIKRREAQEKKGENNKNKMRLLSSCLIGGEVNEEVGEDEGEEENTP